jgi:uncharacterized protein
MTHSNEDLLRRGYAAFSAGDMNTLRSMLADDVAYHVAGSSLVSGDYHGPEEVTGLFARIFELTGGTFRVELDDVLANDQHGVAMHTVYAERDGQVLQTPEVQIFHVTDGKATEVWIVPYDLAAVDKFFG